MEKSSLITISEIKAVVGETNADVKKLSELVLEYSSHRKSNNPIDSRYEDNYFPQTDLVNQIIEDIQRCWYEIYPKSSKIIPQNFWGHIHEKNMSTNKHTHHGANVSAVVYLLVPENAGNIVFWPKEGNPFNIQPKENKIIIFPSWLEHSVTRNMSSSPRISMSVNFEFEENALRRSCSLNYT